MKYGEKKLERNTIEEKLKSGKETVKKKLK